MPGFTYTVVSAGGANSGQGGIMPMPPAAQGRPPAWISYVTVDNPDATAQQAEKLGGKIVVPPRNIPEVGRFAVIQDPQGAAIAIITYFEKNIGRHIRLGRCFPGSVSRPGRPRKRKHSPDQPH